MLEQWNHSQECLLVVHFNAIGIRKTIKIQPCVLSCTCNVTTGWLVLWERKVTNEKFPLQANFPFSNWISELSSTPEITDTGRIKADHCPFSRSQLSFNYRWFSSTPFLHLPSFPSSWCLILLSFSPLPLQTPSASLSASHLHLSCMKSFNGVNQWENNGRARWRYI